MTKLSALDLAENQIEELAPLAGLAGLSSLDLAKNKIVNIKPLGVIARFSVLKLSDNAIEDIGPATQHPPQSMLLVEGNKIADLAPLVAAAKADAEGRKQFAPFLRLYLAGNPLSEAAKNEQLAALKSAGAGALKTDTNLPALQAVTVLPLKSIAEVNSSRMGVPGQMTSGLCWASCSARSRDAQQMVDRGHQIDGRHGVRSGKRGVAIGRAIGFGRREFRLRPARW